jgi:hypothetical protein
MGAMYREYGLQIVPGRMPSRAKSWKRPALAEWAPLHDAFATDFTFARWYGETATSATGRTSASSPAGVTTSATSSSSISTPTSTRGGGVVERADLGA